MIDEEDEKSLHFGIDDSESHLRRIRVFFIASRLSVIPSKATPYSLQKHHFHSLLIHAATMV